MMADMSAPPILGARARRPLVLHITGDYPDGVRPPTTEAVKRLIDRQPALDHVVFSLMRHADPRREYLIVCPDPAPNQKLFAYGHFGLPLGVGLHRSFSAVARRIDAALSSHGLWPDLVHSHRLTFDGIAGDLLARQYRIPHIVSVRGEVESKVLAAKPHYRPLIRRIASEAARVLYVSAWFRPRLERLAPTVAGTGRLFPNIVANVRDRIVPAPAGNRFITAARLDAWRMKGIDRLIRAMAEAGDRLGDMKLDVYGTGRPKSVAAVERLIRAQGLADRVILKGTVSNADFLARLPSYRALALPSRNETFGMVYTEALFAGVPILYGRNSGIDGFLDGLHLGVAVEPTSVRSISDGLVDLAVRCDILRETIAEAAPELHRRFAPEPHLLRYEADVRELTASRVAAPPGAPRLPDASGSALIEGKDGASDGT